MATKEKKSSKPPKQVEKPKPEIKVQKTKPDNKTKKIQLPEQRLEDLDVNKLTPLSPVVMNRQATINIGTIGHVAHGKSTVVKAISGVQTVRFKTELERNITIKLGYANAKIFKCDSAKCPRPGNYASFGSNAPEKPTCAVCGSPMTLQRHVSFVDCPGHDILMATMLNGAAVMDAALLLIAGNEACPQPQTSEHLAAVEIMKLKNILILQNKIDLVKEKESASQYDEIVNFIRGTVADGAPIIPISAQLKYNIEVICEYICKKIPVPVRDFSASPQLIVIRSFDVNKPGEEVKELKGGVAGGSILRGVLKVGQEIEVRPGIVTKDKSGHVKCVPIRSKVVSLFAEQNDLKFAVPGGLIGVGTKIDPTLTRADRLVGQVLGEVGKLPDIFTELEISFFLLRRLLGVKADADKRKKEKVKKLVKGEILMVNIGSTSTGARILQVNGDLAKVVLTSPVCTSEGEKLALSRRVDKHWRLIGWGKIRRGIRIKDGEGLLISDGSTPGEGDDEPLETSSKSASVAGSGKKRPTQTEEDDEEEEEGDEEEEVEEKGKGAKKGKKEAQPKTKADSEKEFQKGKGKGKPKKDEEEEVDSKKKGKSKVKKAEEENEDQPKKKKISKKPKEEEEEEEEEEQPKKKKSAKKAKEEEEEEAPKKKKSSKKAKEEEEEEEEEEEGEEDDELKKTAKGKAVKKKEDSKKKAKVVEEPKKSKTKTKDEDVSKSKPAKKSDKAKGKKKAGKKKDVDGDE